jgi:hypothetical protein
MARAILVAMEMSANREIHRNIHGLVTYTYNLTYISSEPLQRCNFPSEIDTNINDQEKSVSLFELGMMEGERGKTKDKPKIKVNNSIEQLEVN